MATEPRIIGETAEAAVPDSRPAPGPGTGPAPEIGGRDGPEPTRFGDWENNGRGIDF